MLPRGRSPLASGKSFKIDLGPAGLVGLIALAAIVTFCLAMRWFCEEAHMIMAARNWLNTAGLFMDQNALERLFSRIRVRMTGRDPSRPSGPSTDCTGYCCSPGSRRPMRLFRYIWAFPVTLVGLTLAMLACLTGGSVRLSRGVVEAEGGLLDRLLRGSPLHRGGAAMTLGHVILARDSACLAQSREHELAHVRQFERWGPLLLPMYWLTSAWLHIRGYDPYLDHPLEPPPS